MPARPHYRCPTCDAGLVTDAAFDAATTRYGYACPAADCDEDHIPFERVRGGSGGASA